jgi:hypothetical protein
MIKDYCGNPYHYDINISCNFDPVLYKLKCALYGWQDGNKAVMPPYKEVYKDMQKVAK